MKKIDVNEIEFESNNQDSFNKIFDDDIDLSNITEKVNTDNKKKLNNKKKRNNNNIKKNLNNESLENVDSQSLTEKTITNDNKKRNSYNENYRVINEKNITNKSKESNIICGDEKQEKNLNNSPSNIYKNEVNNKDLDENEIEKINYNYPINDDIYLNGSIKKKENRRNSHIRRTVDTSRVKKHIIIDDTNEENGLDKTIENDDNLQTKIKKIKNKLELFICNFVKWQLNIVYAKHLNIDSELITFDLIKKFEDDIKNDEILLRDLALDFTEFYPKYKTYKKVLDGSIKLKLIGSTGKYIFLKKIMDLRPIFGGVVKEEIFLDNFIFFEPVSKYIKENINSHIKNIEISKKVLNFNHPELFFPLAREMKRKFIYHMGPTNSGKTSNALERLAEAGAGI